MYGLMGWWTTKKRDGLANSSTYTIVGGCYLCSVYRVNVLWQPTAAVLRSRFHNAPFTFTPLSHHAYVVIVTPRRVGIEISDWHGRKARSNGVH